ncbi:hypothetical protein V8P79_16170 [Acinetobacter baumannii]
MHDEIAAKKEFIIEIKFFLTEKNIFSKDISEDTELIESRIIDSMLFVELILFLEDFFECEIVLENGDINSFSSINRMFDTFYNKASPIVI